MPRISASPALSKLRILDLTRVRAGPTCVRQFADFGADVIKIENTAAEDMGGPRDGPDFQNLHRNKRSMTLDLKSPQGKDIFLRLVKTADVVVENFRPGVMDRLGLGYAAVSRVNPRIIYCAITGYGQSGPRAMTAAHDLNYAAEAGMLALAAGADGAPVPPAALVADIGGGSYPAVINILLALRERERSGRGCKLDIAMADNLFTFMYWAMGDGLAAQRWPQPGKALVTGGSPRYRIYRTRDDRFVAAAPLEERFWQNFCDAIGLAADARDDSRDPQTAISAVAARIREKTGEQWKALFAGKDVCCSVVSSIEQALADPHFEARGVFERKLTADGKTLPALPVPIASGYRGASAAGYPALGEANSLLDKDKNH